MFFVFTFKLFQNKKLKKSKYCNNKKQIIKYVQFSALYLLLLVHLFGNCYSVLCLQSGHCKARVSTKWRTTKMALSSRDTK